MMKKGYNYPIKIKIALAKNYSVGLAILLYTFLENISIVLRKKDKF
jgi:hypothetical protein